MNVSVRAPEYALRVCNVTKKYPGVRALDDVTLEVIASHVHGIVGENGAGKSTLMKLVSGAIRHDSGNIEVFGTSLPGGEPYRAANAGVAMVYQELTVVPDMSALGNVLLGRLPSRAGVISRRKARAEFDRTAATIGFSIDPNRCAGDLSTAEQQLLEIMRALSSQRKLIILDEPTASLGPEDIHRLHEVIRTLRGQGSTFIYVSHDLGAVLEICDVVTVMREGKIVESRPANGWSKSELIHAMLGATNFSTIDSKPAVASSIEPLLEIRGLQAPGVDLPGLQVRSGEIIGLAGLVGSGRTRLLRTIAGMNIAVAGTLSVRGKVVKWPRSPRQALRYGVALAPEDRKSQGLVLIQSAAWNVALGQFRAASKGQLVSSRRLVRWATQYASRMGLQPGRVSSEVGTLSGGNQQKVILGRLMARGVDCLLLDEPTRGIDVGAKAQVFDTLRELASSGSAIIWTSSELDEVVANSDRIIVIAGGHAVVELPKGSSVRDVLEHSFNRAGDGRQTLAART